MSASDLIVRASSESLTVLTPGPPADYEMLPSGDMTEIGEKGISKSARFPSHDPST